MILKDVRLLSLMQYNFDQENTYQVRPGIFYPNYEDHLSHQSPKLKQVPVFGT